MKNNHQKRLITEREEDFSLLSSLRAQMPAVQKVGEAIDKIVAWLNQASQQVASNHSYQSSIKLEVNYSEPLSLIIADTVLRLLGTRLLRDAERKDLAHQENIVVRSTNRPNINLYVKYKRPKANLPLGEEYVLIASKELVFPEQIKTEVLVEALPVEPVPKVVPSRPRQVEPKEKKIQKPKAELRPAIEKIPEVKEKPEEIEETPPLKAEVKPKVEEKADPPLSSQAEAEDQKEKEFIYRRLKELEDKQKELKELTTQAQKTEQEKGWQKIEEKLSRRPDAPSGVRDPQFSQTESGEKKIEDSLEKQAVAPSKAAPTEVANQVERMADKLQEEETIPSPPPKKKPGILAVLNDLLIGEDEE